MSDEREEDLPEPDPTPGQFIQAGAEANGDIRRMLSTRQLEDGTTETGKPFQLTSQGIRNLMVALYGDKQVFMAEERFRQLSEAEPAKALITEVNEWRAKFAMLQIVVEEPHETFVAQYAGRATVYADAHTQSDPFPYGPDPALWPPPVQRWMLAFTRGLIEYLITPPDAYDAK